MMRFLLALAAAVTVLPAGGLSAGSGLPSPPVAAGWVPSAKQPPELSLVGTLDQVDAASTEIVVRTTSGRQKFVLPANAMIRQGSRTIKASELAAHKGERVKVRYREVAGVRRAEWIVVASPPSRKARSHVN